MINNVNWELARKTPVLRRYRNDNCCPDVLRNSGVELWNRTSSCDIQILCLITSNCNNYSMHPDIPRYIRMDDWTPQNKKG